MQQLFTKKFEAWRPLRWLLPTALLAVALGLSLRLQTIEAALASPDPAVPTLAYSDLWSGKPAPEERDLTLSAAEVPLPLEIRPGQTVGGLLGELGLGSEEVHSAVAALEGHLDVRRLRAGEPCLAYLDEDSRLSELRLRQSGKGWVRLARAEQSWESSWHPFRREIQVRRIEGELEDLLDNAILRAGGPLGLAYKMADVLQWDLDFNRDLKVGDRFRVLYEEVYLDGSYAGLGSIRALVYDNAGRRSEAYRYGEDASYYDAQGRPLRKLFLRSPLPFTRVTSRFSHRRLHPILKVYRPHFGVDYGAPTGTPVRVTANGVVTSAGWSKGGGKTVKVRHSNGYLTAYLHLSRYGKGIRAGARVRQGDVIGYVGSTGLSTAPHLDYRVQKGGRWIDPLSLPNLPAEPIAAEEIDAFLAERDQLRSSLGGRFDELPSGTRMARLEPASTERRPDYQAAGLGRR